jgi:hypothetical protein
MCHVGKNTAEQVSMGKPEKRYNFENLKEDKTIILIMDLKVIG